MTTEQAPSALDSEPDLTYLGEGAQFSAFLTPSGRVYKIPQDLETTKLRVATWYTDPTPEDITAEAEQIHEIRNDSITYVRDLIAQHPEASALFGNPTFTTESDGEIAFSQDYLQSFGDKLIDSEHAEQHALLREAVRLMQELVKFGCSQRVYNIYDSVAIDPSTGKLVVQDFGELNTTWYDAAETNAKRSWAYSYDITERLPSDLREYFVGAMDASMPILVEQLWGLNLA